MRAKQTRLENLARGLVEQVVLGALPERTGGRRPGETRHFWSVAVRKREAEGPEGERAAVRVGC